MTLSEYQAKRSKHLGRIKDIYRDFGHVIGRLMSKNEQWLLLVARTNYYHPERSAMIISKADAFVMDELLTAM